MVFQQKMRKGDELCVFFLIFAEKMAIVAIALTD